jgi:hypothetical protein
MAWGDLLGTFKPDLITVTLNSPEGEEYGGILNTDRGGVLGLGILGSGGLEASTPGVDLEFDDSWVKGESPRWHVHLEDNEIDPDTEIIIDLDYFAPSPPIWLQSSRSLDKGEGKMADYMFFGCQVTGEIKINGKNYEVEGTGHHEHTWSPGIMDTFIKGWDWVHLRLDNGWNIYYGKYYLSKQRLDSKTSLINPYANIIITTDKGETITLLDQMDITTKQTDQLFLLLKIPKQISINARANSLTQPILNSYNIRMKLDIFTEDCIEKIWKIPTYVGMKIGSCSTNGNIEWTDNEGSHDISLDGIGTIWTMRKF